MTTPATETVLRPVRWLKLMTIGAASLFLAGFLTMYLLQGLSITALAFAGLSILVVAGVLEAFTLRVVLSAEALWVSKLGSRKAYARSEIRSVTWAKGCPVTFQLADGRWVKLPEVGSSSQGVVNTIRAWLKRGGSGGSLVAVEQVDAEVQP
jgi:hypothetical protein